MVSHIPSADTHPKAPADSPFLQKFLQDETRKSLYESLAKNPLSQPHLEGIFETLANEFTLDERKSSYFDAWFLTSEDFDVQFGGNVAELATWLGVSYPQDSSPVQIKKLLIDRFLKTFYKKLEKSGRVASEIEEEIQTSLVQTPAEQSPVWDTVVVLSSEQDENSISHTVIPEGSLEDISLPQMHETTASSESNTPESLHDEDPLLTVFAEPDKALLVQRIQEVWFDRLFAFAPEELMHAKFKNLFFGRSLPWMIKKLAITLRSGSSLSLESLRNFLAERYFPRRYDARQIKANMSHLRGAKSSHLNLFGQSVGTRKFIFAEGSLAHAQYKEVRWERDTSFTPRAQIAPTELLKNYEYNRDLGWVAFGLKPDTVKMLLPVSKCEAIVKGFSYATWLGEDRPALYLFVRDNFQGMTPDELLTQLGLMRDPGSKKSAKDLIIEKYFPEEFAQSQKAISDRNQAREAKKAQRELQKKEAAQYRELVQLEKEERKKQQKAKEANANNLIKAKKSVEIYLARRETRHKNIAVAAAKNAQAQALLEAKKEEMLQGIIAVGPEDRLSLEGTGAINLYIKEIFRERSIATVAKIIGVPEISARDAESIRDAFMVKFFPDAWAISQKRGLPAQECHDWLEMMWIDRLVQHLTNLPRFISVSFDDMTLLRFATKVGVNPLNDDGTFATPLGLVCQIIEKEFPQEYRQLVNEHLIDSVLESGITLPPPATSPPSLKPAWASYSPHSHS